jgi:hypothetical protein
MRAYRFKTGCLLSTGDHIRHDGPFASFVYLMKESDMKILMTIALGVFALCANPTARADGSASFEVSGKSAVNLKAELNVPILEDDCGDRVNCGLAKQYQGKNFSVACSNDADSCELMISYPVLTPYQKEPTKNLKTETFMMIGQKAKLLKERMTKTKVEGKAYWLVCFVDSQSCNVTLYSDEFRGF